jgi:hypothetical protein
MRRALRLGTPYRNDCADWNDDAARQLPGVAVQRFSARISGD